MLLGISACTGLNHERLVYDEGGIQIGIQQDLSTDDSKPSAVNSHPAQLTPQEIRALLGSLTVRGWSGTIVGIFKTPQPIPMITEEELPLVAPPIATALTQAGPLERVFFSISDIEAPYNNNRTSGALFVRGPYLHIILTDHRAFTPTDTGGGEDYKDPYDTKTMKLHVSKPVEAASLPPEQEPRWKRYERVHISLNIQEVLTALSSPPPPPQPIATAPLPATQVPVSSQKGGGLQTPTGPDEGLSLQLRDLSNSNVELRSKLKEQAQDMQALKDELRRLRQELEGSEAKPKPKPGSTPPSP